MDLKEIKQRVKEIEEIKRDYPEAHCREDELHRAFIVHISKTGSTEQAKMARAILKTEKMDFCRWCA